MFRNTRYIATPWARRVASRRMTSFKIHGAVKEDSDSDLTSDDELEQQDSCGFPSDGPSIDDRILEKLRSTFKDSSDWIKVGTSTSSAPQKSSQRPSFPGQPELQETDRLKIRKAFRKIRKSVKKGKTCGKLRLPVEVGSMKFPRTKLIRRHCDLKADLLIRGRKPPMSLLLTVDYSSSSPAKVHWCYENTLILPENTAVEQKVVETDEKTYRATLSFMNFTADFGGKYYFLIENGKASKWSYFQVNMSNQPESEATGPQFTVTNNQKNAVLCGVKLSDLENERFALEWMRDGEKVDDDFGEGVSIRKKHEDLPKGSYAILEIQNPSLLPKGSYSVKAISSTGITKEFQLNPFASTSFPPKLLSSPATIVDLFFNETTKILKAQFMVYVKYRACNFDHETGWKMRGNECRSEGSMFEKLNSQKVRIGADSYASGYCFESTQLLHCSHPPPNLHFHLLIKTSSGQERCVFKLDLGQVVGSNNLPSTVTLPDTMI